jgi:hypothetical protein
MAYDLAPAPRKQHPDARMERGRARPDTGTRHPAPETAEEFLSRRESESLTMGPGLVVTKSQARGAGVGLSIGAVVGALAGTLVGLALFDGIPALIMIICGAVAGCVAGGVFGGIAGGSSKSQLGYEKADF